MQSYLLEGTVTALSSVSHIGQTRGITAKLRREKFVLADGSVEEIPVISGNSMRGMLRDRGMMHMLHQLGYGVNETTGEVTGLSLQAFYFLFSGGSLSKDGGNGLDLALARKLRDLIPLVSVFGGAVGNQIMPGKLKVGKLLPVCQELAHLLPARFVSSAGSIWDMVQEEAYTRKDDEKNENMRMMIKAPERLLLEASQAEKRARRGTENEIDREAGAHQQMRYYCETLAAGTTFFWDVVLDHVTDVEFESFIACLVEFSKTPYIGGKSNVGHGKVAVRFENWIELDPRATPVGAAIGPTFGAKYAEHLLQHGEEIRDGIQSIF